MKIGLLIGLLLSALLVVSCAVQQPTNQPAETITPPVLEVETSTAPATESAQVYQVVIEAGKLMPVDVEINAGDTVEWVNKDTVRYTLVFSGSEERLSIGGIVDHVFATSGTVGYRATVVQENRNDRQRELQGMIVVN